MATFRLEIAYEGSRFRGWAAQPGLRTVQAELEAALGRILGTEPTLTVAGRTDAGVHATGQVASFEAEVIPDGLLRSVNAVLPPDVAVKALTEAEDGFDARRDARSRAYRYRVLASPVRDPFEEGRALWWPQRVDADQLRACADATVGTHDFTAFTPTATEHVRFQRDVFACGWSGERPGILTLEIEADAFMRHMVRVLVGTMLEVGGGRRSLENFHALLRGAPRERAGDTAPPHALYLVRVRY